MHDQAAVYDFVFYVQFHLLGLFVPELFNQVEQIAGIHQAGIGGDPSGQVAQPDDAYAVDIHFFAKL